MKNFDYIKKAFSVLKPKSTILPILECVCVLDNRLMITDLNTSIIFKDVDLAINFVQNGTDFIKACGFIANPKFEVNGQKLTISSDDETFTFSGEDTDNFPKIQYDGVVAVGKIGAKDCKLIQRALSVISRDELRPALCMVAVKDGYIMASDGHSAIFEKSEFANSKTILVGKKCAKLLDIFEDDGFSVSLSETRLVFENDIAIIVQRVDDNHFPDLMAIVPKECPISVSVAKKEFYATLKKALLCAPSMMYTVVFNVNGRLTISSEDHTYGMAYKRQISCEHTGDNIKVGFNAKMLLNLISTIKTKEINLNLTESSRACVINKNSLLMPVNIR